MAGKHPLNTNNNALQTSPVPTGQVKLLGRHNENTSSASNGHCPGQKQPEETLTLQKQLYEAREQIARLSAELQNLKKRHTRQLEEVVLYANQKLVEKLLPIVDDLERSLLASDKHRNFEAFRNGVELIYQHLLKILREEGVKPFKSLGQPFDYSLHEAVLAVHRKGVKPGTVVEEIQRGYQYRDRVLRHAKVIVSK